MPAPRRRRSSLPWILLTATVLTVGGLLAAATTRYWPTLTSWPESGLKQRVSDLEQRAIDAMRGGRDDLAMQAAEAIAAMTTDIEASRQASERFAAEVARGIPHIARVYTRDELLAGEGAASGDFVGRAAQLGFYGPRSSDLVLIPEPYFMFYASGTTHAAPFSYDNHVPLIFYGPGIRAGRYYQPVTVNDVAPTLAAILEVETPSGAAGRVLSMILQ